MLVSWTLSSIYQYQIFKKYIKKEWTDGRLALLTDDEDFYLLLHNIDGMMLRAEKTQNVLSMLAQIPKIHVVASVDQINAPLSKSTVCVCVFGDGCVGVLHGVWVCLVGWVCLVVWMCLALCVSCRYVLVCCRVWMGVLGGCLLGWVGVWVGAGAAS